MTMKCEIIRDLLPVYCDGLASEETRAEVDRHVAECDDCRERLRLMREAVPDVPKPDIQPMKKIKRSLRLRLALVIGMVCLGLLVGLYNMLVVHPLPISSKGIVIEHYSRMNYGNMLYVYYNGKDESTLDVPKDSKFVIDKENDCVWLDGKKAIWSTKSVNGVITEIKYVPANGVLVREGILCVNIKCDTPFKAVRYNYDFDQWPRPSVTNPYDYTLTLCPCLPFRQDINACLEEGNVFRAEFEGYKCIEGAKLTIHCRDKDIVVDLHELAVEEGIFEE